jgi:hypothetical protein
VSHPGRLFRVNTEYVAQANEQVKEVIAAEGKMADVFFSCARSFNMGSGIAVEMCRLCEQWLSPSRRDLHLRLMHGFEFTAVKARLAETMHALGADPKDIATALGARV